MHCDRARACDKVVSDLGLGGVFFRVLRFLHQLQNLTQLSRNVAEKVTKNRNSKFQNPTYKLRKGTGKLIHKHLPILLLPLTHLCLKNFLMSVIWTCHIFEYNFGMKHEFTNYLKESCRWTSDEQFSFKYFLNITIAREISPKLPGCFGCYWHEKYISKISDGKLLIRTLSTNLLQICFKCTLHSKVIFESITDPDDTRQVDVQAFKG